MASTVENIKAKLSITDVVGGYVKLEKAGVNMKARCPFHNERTASFYVSPSRQSFHCFGCNKGGDMFSFIEEIEGVPFVEALTILANRAGVPVERNEGAREAQSEKDKLRGIMAIAVDFYAKALATSVQAKEYLHKRGVSDETIARFKIGVAPAGEWRVLATHLKTRGVSEKDAEKAGLLVSSPKGYYDRFRSRIMFPVFDVSGAPIGFSARILPGISLPSGEEPAKYINTAQTVLYDKSRAMYGLHLAKNAIRTKDRCVLVEGQMDTVMSAQAGVEEVVAVSGTALTNDHVVLLRRFTENLIIVLDSDDAGFKASARSVQMAYASGMQVRALSLPSGKDPADFILERPDDWKLLVEKSVPFIDFALNELFRREGDNRKRTRGVREYVYPYLRLIRQPLEREEGFRQISKMLDLGIDAVREDYSVWEKGTAPLSEGEIAQKTSMQADKDESTRAKKIFDRLRGIYIWQSAEKSPQIDPAVIEKRITKLLEELPGANLTSPDIFSFQISGEEKEREVFEAESYYQGSETLEQELETLISELAQEILRDRLTRAVSILRNAEREGKANTEELLALCKDLSSAITARQQKAEKL